MITKFVIPVIDTENFKFECNDRMSDNDYFGMVYQQVMSTNSMMNQFAYAYQNGLFHQNRVVMNGDIRKDDTKFTYSESEAIIKDSNNNDITINDLYSYVKNNKKFIIKVNINPDTLESDAESTLRYWMDESRMVLKDDTLDNITRLKSLPVWAFILDTAVNDGDDEKPIFQILGCKVMQIYKQENNNFYFALLVSEILEQ